jgi:hypothetical protein
MLLAMRIRRTLRMSWRAAWILAAGRIVETRVSDLATGAKAK